MRSCRLNSLLLTRTSSGNQSSLSATTDKRQVIYEVLSSVTHLASGKTSILYCNTPEFLAEEDLFSLALAELEINVPFLYDLLNTIMGESGNKNATISMIYAMILKSRNKKVSAMQRLVTALAIKGHADNKLLSRLNKLNITLSAESKKNIVNECSEFLDEQLVKEVKTGHDGKLNGDNVDIYVTTNDIRMNNKNKDYHFFATDWTPFRVTPEDFNSNDFLKCHLTSEKDNVISHDKFKPDISQFKDNIKVLVGRILVKNLNFEWMDLVVPQHIQHPLEDITARPTTSYCLPILLKNETKYEDCIDIMDSYEEQLYTWYSKAGRGDEFDKLRVPVGGDQLTRVRLDGAKCLRLGSPTAKESFDNLFPVVIEMFHTQMDFLEKTFKKFMTTASRRKEGTLSNFKVILARTSVNGNVKSRYKAHEDFLMLAGEAYITHAALDHFGMENLTDQPTKNCPPSDIGKSHFQKRLNTFNEIMDEFLKKILSPFSFEEVPSGNSVVLEVGGCTFNCPVENEMVTLQLDVHGRKFLVTIPVKTLKEKGHITVSTVTDISVDIKLVKPDDLYNYVLNFLQHFLILLNFKDSIKEGDIFRVNNMLKLMVPYFYKHSPLSKYMVECLDFILKTEMLLPKELAIQVRVSSFVNPKGKKGKNKAADMQKENQVKTLKDHIKGLGANKTEESIIKVSKAAPVIERIVTNVDRQIHEKTVSTTHKHRSREEDLQCIVQVLNDIKPFEAQNGRVLPGFPNIKSSVFEELNSSKKGLTEKVMEIIIRLKRGIVQE